MEILSSRVLLRPRDPAASRAFYADVLGLAIYREFGPADHPGTVFFLGNGLLEVSGGGGPEASPDARADARADVGADAGADSPVRLWLQVRDVDAAAAELRRQDVPILREPRTEFWGLREMWIADPGGVPIVLVEIPADHPLRRDQR